MKAKTRTQMASEYGVSRKTFYNWLKKHQIAIPANTLIAPKDQKKIYSILGKPKKVL